MHYYRSTFIALCFAFLSATVAFVTAMMWGEEKRRLLTTTSFEVVQAENARRKSDGKLLEEEKKLKPLRTFLVAWEPHLRPAAGKDLGNHLRNALATLATQSGLTSEGATIPADARPYSIAGSSIKVQQLSLSVVGDSLPAILTWLGAFEGQFPYTRVESVSISGYASRSVQLTLTLLHPVHETTVDGLGSGQNHLVVAKK